MWQRVKQLWSALHAELTSEDYDFINQHLSPVEKELFLKCDLVTQKHCLRVANTALDLAQKEARSIDYLLLVKSALLHDIGKRKGDLNILYRVVTVIIFTLMPSLGRTMARKGKGLRHALYVYLYHPEEGAKLAKQADLDQEIINIIKYHHNSESDSPEQKLVTLADNLN